MSIMETIKKRRSVRAYQDKEVPHDDLEDILNAARLAPSASNKQQWKFIVVKKEELRKKLVSVANEQKFVGQAPVVIAGVALEPDYTMSCEVPSYAVDLAIALDHITLVAAEKGLGTCWIGAFSQSEARKVLEVPEEYKITALMPLGYPADKPGKKNRKELEEVVSYNQF
ncbi:MAG: nitroreductase family protein [Bacillota bacterium]